MAGKQYFYWAARDMVDRFHADLAVMVDRFHADLAVMVDRFHADNLDCRQAYAQGCEVYSGLR